MLLVRPSTPEDIPAQRLLWHLAFGDEGAYVDNFYSTYYRPERVLVLEEGGQVRSMTAWFDTTFVVPGRGAYRAAYLYAVATHPDCRGRGLAGRLLAEADRYFRALSIPAVTTVPAGTSVPAGRSWDRATTLPEVEEVVPLIFRISPASVRRWLAAEAVSPATLGTVQGSVGFSAPR